MRRGEARVEKFGRGRANLNPVAPPVQRGRLVDDGIGRRRHGRHGNGAVSSAQSCVRPQGSKRDGTRAIGAA